MAKHKIEIIPGNPPTVDQETLQISKKGGDRVKWWSRSKDWAVAFDVRTPFDLHYYGHCNSETDQIMVEPGSEGYKYTIFVEGNSADPMIIVKP